MNLILLEREHLHQNRTTLQGESARHVREVLAAKPGDTIRIGVLDGPAGLATIEAVTADSVELVVSLAEAPPPRPRIDVLLAVPRPKVLKRLWAQLAALGVDRLFLTNAAKVERPYFDTHVLKEEFFRPLLIEGLQQARDTRLPRVTIHRRLRPFVEDELGTLTDAAIRLVADPSGQHRIHEPIGAGSKDRVILAIGPEGGWTPFELDLLAAQGFVAVGLGPRTLRTDTACVALLALVNDALERE